MFVTPVSFQKHFLWTILGPSSSHSLRVIHIGSKPEIVEIMAPPSQQLCLRSAGDSTSGCMVEGASAWISFCILPRIPLNIVQPPAKTMFLNRSLLISISHLAIAENVCWWIPSSTGKKSKMEGLNINSGHLRHSSLIEMWWPVGSLYLRTSVCVLSWAPLSSAS